MDCDTMTVTIGGGDADANADAVALGDSLRQTQPPSALDRARSITVPSTPSRRPSDPSAAACRRRRSSMSSSSPFERAQWCVHKFGGTSLAAAACYAASAAIVRQLPLTVHATVNTAADSSAEAATADTSGSVPLRKCVVVSAMGEVKGGRSSVAALIRSHTGRDAPPQEKVTNLLIRATDLAAARDASYLDLLAALRRRHTDVVNELLGPGDDDAASSAADPVASALRSNVLTALTADFDDLAQILRAVWLGRGYTHEAAWWLGMGEVWSARLMHAYLSLLDERAQAANGTVADEALRQRAVFVDARDIIHLAGHHKDPTPNYELSQTKLNEWLNSSSEIRNARIVVVTGYVATTAGGTPTTLGRDGSDYSASILGALLHARDATIWTDVDGVYSADPGQVDAAVVLPCLSYDEASELAYFGAKVLHPKTMTPAVLHAVPLWIRNTFNPTHPGSCIVSAAAIAKREGLGNAPAATSSSASPPAQAPVGSSVGFGVRGLSEISSLSLLVVEGTGMIGVPGVCARLFGALRAAGLSVVLVTQAGSEHSICLALPRAQGALGVRAIRHEFRDELQSGEVQTVAQRDNVSCIAIVGDGMRSRRGAAARMFSALARADVNIIAIAQGSSERNISFIVAAEDARRALRAVHAAFMAPALSPPASPLSPTSAALGIDDGAGGSFAKPTSSPSPLAALTTAAPAAATATQSQAQSDPLDFLFPLPVTATLEGLRARGIRVARVVVLHPTALSHPPQPSKHESLDMEVARSSFRVMAQSLVAVAAALRCSGDGGAVGPEDVVLPDGLCDEPGARLVGVIEVGDDTTAAPRLSLSLVHEPPAALLHQAEGAPPPQPHLTVVAIYVRGGSNDSEPILLQGVVTHARFD